ncbi:hypothetical protein N9W17_00990 [Jannaschia sp.]|nr:hypothetical protein [Jannaschia sp.]
MNGFIHALFLDSAAIAIVVSTLVLESVLLVDPTGLGAALVGLGPFVLTLVWLYLAGMAMPLVTVLLLLGDRPD